MMIRTLPFTVTPAKPGVQIREGMSLRQECVEASLRRHDVSASEGIANA
jgi:hypothetical protein